MDTKLKIPNTELRYQREARGWSQKRLADLLGTTKEMVSKWERGEKPGKYYQEKLCDLFGKTAYELGFVKEPDRPTTASNETSDQKRLENNDLQGVLAQAFTQGLQGIAKELANNDLQGRFTQAVTQGILGVLANNDLQERLAQIVTQVIMGAVKELGGQDVNELRRKILEIMAGIAGGQAALGQIPSVGFPLLSTPHARPKQALAGDEIVADAGHVIRACWHLMKGKEFQVTEELLNSYTPTLLDLTFQPSPSQPAIAQLATQACMMRSCIAHHHLNLAAREMYCQEAVQCSRMAGDKALHAEALSYLGYTYLYCHPPRPQKSIEILREALRELADADNLVRSDICIGLAYAYALINNESQAKEAIHLAQDGFPSHPEQCDSFFYADIARDTFYRWEAKIYLDLAQHGQQQEYYQHAWHLLEQSARTEARSERSSLATVIYQSAAALGMGNLELYEAYMRKGLVLAKEMGSQRRLMEAYTIAQNTPPTWSSDQRVKELEEEFFVPLRLKGMQSGTP